MHSLPLFSPILENLPLFSFKIQYLNYAENSLHIRARTKTNYHKLSLGNANKYIRQRQRPINVKCIFARCINQFLKDISVSQDCAPEKL